MKLLRRLRDELYAIRARLLLVNLLVVAVPLVGVSFAHFYEKEMLVELEADMVHQGELVRAELLADPAGPGLAGRQPMLARAAKETRTRIRLLDPAGNLVADSHHAGPPEGREVSPGHVIPLSIEAALYSARAATRSAIDSYEREPLPQPTPLTKRPEVQDALHGRYGAATRIWRGGDLVYLFAALPVVRDGQVLGVVYVTRTTVPVRLAMRRLRGTLFEILFGALCATAVMTLFLAGTVSRPLRKLTKIAGRIAEGDRTQHLRLEGRDEIAQLARAFDAMATKLDARARYVGELAANISHEFKSPLTGIRGAAELLQEGAADDPAARARFLENILADANRLDRLVSRLLELSRFESDDAPLERIDYEALVRSESEKSHGAHEVRVEYAAGAKEVLGRRAHLASALGNLLDNAQQHAAAGTPIVVRVSDAARGRIETTVHNAGDPIPPGNLDKIWTRFFTTRAGAGGTGLGLPIVKTVVIAHGGNVGVASAAETGTTFRFDLPAVA